MSLFLLFLCVVTSEKNVCSQLVIELCDLKQVGERRERVLFFDINAEMAKRCVTGCRGKLVLSSFFSLSHLFSSLNSPLFHRHNFDVRKGPISSEWFIGAGKKEEEDLFF